MMNNTLHLNIDGADQGPTTDGAFFDWFNYVLTAGATPTETKMLIPRLRRLFIDNHGAGSFLVEANTQSERFTFFLDAHDRLPIFSAVPIVSLNFVNLVLEPRNFMPPGAVAQGGNAWPNLANPTDVGASSFVAVTGGQTYFTLNAPPRVRPQFSQTYLADGLNGTQLAYVNADGSLSVRGPALYNPATGAYEAQRTPTVYKYVNNAALPTTVWTPTAGKRFRLLGGMVTASAAGTAAAPVNLFEDVSFMTVITTAAAANVMTPFSLPGNGYLASAPNNALRLSIASGLANATAIVYGTEE